MKTVFIINPCAGQGKKEDELIRKINAIHDENVEIYITKAVGDATCFIKDYYKSKGPARFIACGGDGTFSEVLNGVMQCKDAEIGLIPIGTGNDFCRNFSHDYDFENILQHINGKSIKCDAIQYEVETPHGIHKGYCANMVNIGFDCNVADLTAEMKKKPFVSGSLAYLISIFIMLIKKKGANLKIEVDGVERHNGKLLLTSIANGSFCGGGIKSNPLASISDGMINFNIIKNVSRLHFLYLLPFYMKGNFLKLKNIERVAISEKCKEITVTPFEKDIKICVDGEILSAGKTTFKIDPGAFSFVLPRK